MSNLIEKQIYKLNYYKKFHNQARIFTSNDSIQFDYQI